MILRIADESARTERVPWLTLALIAVCLACFVLPRAQRSFTGEGAQVGLEQASDFWLEHPYLEPERSVAEAAAFGAGHADIDAFVTATRSRSARAPADAETHEQEQTGLDFLSRLALRGSDAKPGSTHAFRRFGLNASAPRALSWLTHVFLHSGWIHLGLTLLLFGLAGPVLESRLGHAIFTGVCVSSGLAAASTHLLVWSSSSAPLVGASGVAAGAIGAFLAHFGSGRAQFHYYTLHGLRPRLVAVDLGAWLLAPVALLVQLVLSLLFLESAVWAGSDWAANLAGLLGGGAIGLFLKRSKLEQRLAARAVETRARALLDPRIKRSITARERSLYPEAIELAGSVLRERPDDVDALQASWDAHVAAGRAGDGSRSARRLVELYARRGDLANGARIWDELVRVAHRSPVGSTTLLRIVPELIVQARRDAAIAALRAAAETAGSGLTVGQASRLAELGVELDPPTALRAARFALESEELVDERRARLEQLVLSLENAGVRVKSAPAGDPGPAAQETITLAAEDLSAPEEFAACASEPSPQPDELFELEPTQIGGEASPSAPELATVFYDAPLASAPSSARIKVTPAMPVALDLAGLRVRLEGGVPSLIEWTRVQAVGVGLISGLGPNPLVVIDLAMNWADAPDDALDVMRLRSDGFRARQFVTGAENAQDALRTLLAEILARTGAVPLPDAAGAHGLPFREYASLDAYQSAVLLSES